MAVHSNSPLYVKLQNELRRQIASGQLAVGARVPREDELCSLHNVSPITVRRAMTNLAEEGLIDRVPGAGTFVKNSLPTEQNKSLRTISVVLGNLYGFFPSAILTGVEAVARQVGYKTQIYISDDSYSIERDHIQNLINEGTGGIVVFGVCNKTVNPNCDVFLEVKKQGIPLVLVDTYLPQLDLDHVVSDDFQGSYAITDHFIKLGHREIGYIRADESVTSIEARYAGFQKAMADNDLPIKSKYVLASAACSDHHDYQGRKIAAALRDFMEGRKGDLPSAFLCYTDGLAAALYQTLNTMGINVPDDIAIGGFGGGYEAEMSPVPLTTVSQPKQELGEQAVELLLKRINNPVDNEERIHITLPTKLVVRNSCGSK